MSLPIRTGRACGGYGCRWCGPHVENIVYEIRDPESGHLGDERMCCICGKQQWGWGESLCARRAGEHASVEAIDAQLGRAQAQERRWHLRAEWLVSLRADRVAQQQDAPPVEPHPTQADLDAALTVLDRFLGQDAAALAAEAQQADTVPVKEVTRRYAEQLRDTPGTVVADGHTGWDCAAGASLIVEASTPGPGKLGTHHGVIYACAAHRATAVERITSGGYEVDPRPAPPGHRWNPWPCGHVTAHDADALAVLTAGARQDGGTQ